MTGDDIVISASVPKTELRPLLRWMDEEGFHRFADLDGTALLRFQQTTMERRSRAGSLVSGGTVRAHLMVLVYLYHYREELGDGVTSQRLQAPAGLDG